MTGARAVIAAAVLLLGVSACSSDDPEPIVAPTPSSSAPSDPSTSPVSGSSAPTMPPEAMGDDAASAEAFVKFYWETVNYAQETGDVTALRSLSSKCRGCDAGIEFIADVYRSGGSIEGGTGRVTDLHAGFVGENHDRAIIDFVVVSSEQDVDRPGSKDDETYSGGRQPVRMILDPASPGWVVVYMGEQ